MTNNTSTKKLLAIIVLLLTLTFSASASELVFNCDFDGGAAWTLEGLNTDIWTPETSVSGFYGYLGIDGYTNLWIGGDAQLTSKDFTADNYGNFEVKRWSSFAQGHEDSATVIELTDGQTISIYYKNDGLSEAGTGVNRADTGTYANIIINGEMVHSNLSWMHYTEYNIQESIKYDSTSGIVTYTAWDGTVYTGNAIAGAGLSRIVFESYGDGNRDNVKLSKVHEIHLYADADSIAMPVVEPEVPVVAKTMYLTIKTGSSVNFGEDTFVVASSKKNLMIKKLKNLPEDVSLEAYIDGNHIDLTDLNHNGNSHMIGKFDKDTPVSLKLTDDDGIEYFPSNVEELSGKDKYGFKLGDVYLEFQNVIAY